MVSDNRIYFDLKKRKKNNKKVVLSHSLIPKFLLGYTTVSYQLNSRFVYTTSSKFPSTSLIFSRLEVVPKAESMRGGLIFFIEKRNAQAGRAMVFRGREDKEGTETTIAWTNIKNSGRTYLFINSTSLRRRRRRKKRGHFVLFTKEKKKKEEKKRKERKLHKKGKIEGARAATSGGRRRSLSGATTCFVIH